jgi:hypothetical protein
MSIRVVLVAIAMTIGVASPAAAQEACKMTQVAKPLSPADMYKMASERAKAWKPDATLASMSTTTLGLLKPDGTAASWHLIFVSESARACVSIDTGERLFHVLRERGKAAAACRTSSPTSSATAAALYAIAKQQGDALLAQAYGVMLGTAAAPARATARGTSTITRRAPRIGGLLVIVDANTGKLEKVIK